MGIRGGKGDEGEGRARGEGWRVSFARPLQDSQFRDCLGCACMRVCEFHPIYNLESY